MMEILRHIHSNSIECAEAAPKLEERRLRSLDKLRYILDINAEVTPRLEGRRLRSLDKLRYIFDINVEDAPMLEE